MQTVTYVTNFSFVTNPSPASLSTVSEYVDRLRGFVKHKRKKSQRIAFSTDYLDDKNGDGVYAIIEGLRPKDPFAADQMLNEFYNLPRSAMTEDISSQDALNLVVQSNQGYLENSKITLAYKDIVADDWPNVMPGLHISGWQSLFEFECKLLGEHPISLTSFLARAKELFDNIVYHSDFDLTLKELDSVDKYSKVVSVVMRSLHEIGPSLPTTGGSDDLLKRVAEQVASNGRSLRYSGQGSNKKHLKFDFLVDGVMLRKVNCEFHLKIDENDRGEASSVRVYFGFVSAKSGGKHICLAHIGGHK